jgi:hypothetical protein
MLTNCCGNNPRKEFLASTKQTGDQHRLDSGHRQRRQVIAAVDAVGTKPSLSIIGKGKTPRCLSALDLAPGVWTATSQSVWTTSEVTCGCFCLFRQSLYPTGPFGLVLHPDAAHRAVLAKLPAAMCKIEPICIRLGCRERLQPLISCGHGNCHQIAAHPTVSITILHIAFRILHIAFRIFSITFRILHIVFPILRIAFLVLGIPHLPHRISHAAQRILHPSRNQPRCPVRLFEMASLFCVFIFKKKQ